MRSQRKLWNAVARGNVSAVRKALRNGADANRSNPLDDLHTTPLILACKKGYAETVRVLISEGNANVDTPNRLGDTPLIHATCGRRKECIVEILRHLLDAGADPNATAEEGYTALHLAHTAHVARLLLDAGANVQRVEDGFNGSGRAPLHGACRRGETDVAQVLLSVPGGAATLHWRDNNGDTPLHYAARRPCSHLIRLLHSFNADVNARNNFTMNTPMHYCMLHNDSVDVIRYMVHDMAADLDARNSAGDSPLHFARSAAAARILLERGVDVESRNNDGATPLIRCTGNLAWGVVQELTAAGANLTAVENSGRTALDRARTSRGFGAEAIFDYLLQCYRNQVVGMKGRLALHWIFQQVTYWYISVQGKADYEDFHPPLNHLQMQIPLGKLCMNHVETLVHLFDTNSMIRTRDENGAVPLHHACQKGAPLEILRTLLHLDEIAPTATNIEGGALLTPRCRDHRGVLPLHALLTSQPSVWAVKLLLQVHPASASTRALNGDYPLMVACESGASENIIFELLKAYPNLVRK